MILFAHATILVSIFVVALAAVPQARTQECQMIGSGFLSTFDGVGSTLLL
jgi:hypothetical protein